MAGWDVTEIWRGCFLHRRASGRARHRQPPRLPYQRRDRLALRHGREPRTGPAPAVTSVPRREYRHVPEPTREPSMDDRLEAEAVDAAVALMVPVLKAFMADKPSRQIAEMQKPHAQKPAIAAISGWIAKRAGIGRASGRGRGGQAG